MKTYKVHFIRHGLTKENANGQYIGSTDVSLSPEGKKQLEKLKKDFDYPNAGILYISPLLRCVETADILYDQMEKITLSGLSECDFGKWEGKTATELQNDPDFIQWISGGHDGNSSGGETMSSFEKRVCDTFEWIVNQTIKENKKDAIIVTHGGVIMTILKKFGLPKAKSYEWISNNGCGYSARVMPSLWMREKVFEVYAQIPYSGAQNVNDDSAYVVDLVKNVKTRGDK